MKKKTLIIILTVVVIYVAVCVAEFCYIFATQDDNTWNYLKEFFDWYFTLLF